MCQCPHGLVPHCYGRRSYYEIIWRKSVSMPSRASTSLLQRKRVAILTREICVSMPSRASTSLLLEEKGRYIDPRDMCQCPHGLVPHCYVSST